MKRIAGIIFIAATVAATAFADRRVVPLAGHVRGLNNTFWTTDLQLSNDTDAIETVHLTLHPNAGAAVSREVTLSPRESVLVRDVAAPAAFGKPDGTEWLGQLELSSNGSFSASARTFTAGDGGGTYGDVSASIDPSLFAKG